MTPRGLEYDDLKKVGQRSLKPARKSNDTEGVREKLHTRSTDERGSSMSPRYSSWDIACELSEKFFSTGPSVAPKAIITCEGRPMPGHVLTICQTITLENVDHEEGV